MLLGGFTRSGDTKMNDTIKYIAKKYRLYLDRPSPIVVRNVNMEGLAELMGELGFKEGAEIGVAGGGYSEMLCQKIPGLKLHAVDVWESYPGYIEYGKKIRAYCRMARKRLKPYGVNIVKKYSMDAVKDFKDESLDFVFIDCAHDFKSVAEDIYEWSKKVRIGGVVYGHDYRDWWPGESTHPVHVKPVVQAYMQAFNIRPWFVFENSKDRYFNPCWLYVRQEEDWI